MDLRLSYKTYWAGEDDPYDCNSKGLVQVQGENFIIQKGVKRGGIHYL